MPGLLLLGRGPRHHASTRAGAAVSRPTHRRIVVCPLARRSRCADRLRARLPKPELVGAARRGWGDPARWIDVDVREQTLVAYEGDTPVFATLVSTGRADRPTARGLFSICEKEIRGPMHGDQPLPYFVDGKAPTSLWVLIERRAPFSKRLEVARR